MYAIEHFKNKIFTEVQDLGNELIFQMEDGTTFSMHHQQDCCESVWLEEIIGDLEDLENSAILEAEQVSSYDSEPLKENHGSYTWTFYKLGTAKGHVTLRWYGTSNGYYSESVNIYKTK